jgi:DNA replication protein DnaC
MIDDDERDFEADFAAFKDLERPAQREDVVKAIEAAKRVQPIASELSVFTPPPAKPCPTCGEEIFIECPKCGIVDDARKHRAERLRRFEASLPERYRSARFDKPELIRERIAMKSPQDFARNLVLARGLVDARIMLVHGASGTGKTTLVAALLRERIERGGGDGVFVRAADLATAQIKHRAGQGDAELISVAKACALLVVDDLGTNDTHPMSELGEILFKRHDSESKSTWITTWMDRDKLGERYGGGVARRYWDDARRLKLEGPAKEGSKS